MIRKFVERFQAAQGTMFVDEHPDSYGALVVAVVRVLADAEDYGGPDPGRIHQINDGDYRGTLLYVIGESGSQPSTYWAVAVDYGSCSGCDTLQAINRYGDEEPTPQQTADYRTLALHIVQGLREITSSSEATSNPTSEVTEGEQ